MKLIFHCACTATLFVILIAGACLAADNSIAKIDKKTVLNVLQSPLDVARQAGLVNGDNRFRIDPFLIEILNDFVSTNSSDVVIIPHGKSLFENLMLWLASPPNAEALIGVNEILRKPREDWLRSGCLSYLDRLDGERRLEFPIQGGVERLRIYFAQSSSVVPLVAQLMAKALAQHGDATGKNLLLTTLRNEGASQYRRIESARALLYVDAKCEDALKFASAYLADENVSKHEKTRTKEVLFEVGDAYGQTWIDGLLTSTNAYQVLYASQVLVRSGDLRGITNALSLLQNPDREIGRRARKVIEIYVLNASVDSLDPSRLKWNNEKGRFEMAIEP